MAPPAQPTTSAKTKNVQIQQQEQPQSGSGGSSAAALDSSSGGNVVAGPPRRVSTQEVQMVQNLIERCMQQYIPQNQVVKLLQNQAKVEPSFTTLVWQKLEEQNPDFFRMYYVRLKLKEQIVMFNYLLEQQVNMVQKLYSSWISTIMPPPPPGSAAWPPPGMPPLPPGMPPPGMPFTFPGMPPGMMPPGMPPGMVLAGMAGHPSAARGNAGAAATAAGGSSSQAQPAAGTSSAAGAGPSHPAQAASDPGSSLPLSDMDGMDLLDAALEASGNIDLSLLHLHGTMDDLMDGVGLSDLQHPGSNLLLDMNLPQMHKAFSFSDLNDLGGDMNMGALAPVDQSLDFGLHMDEDVKLRHSSHDGSLHPPQDPLSLAPSGATAQDQGSLHLPPGGLGLPNDGLGTEDVGADGLHDTSGGLGAHGGSAAFHMGLDMGMDAMDASQHFGGHGGSSGGFGMGMDMDMAFKMEEGHGL